MKVVPSRIPARLDWPFAIGHFLLNFGSLKALIASFLKEHLEAKEFARFRKRHQADRLVRLAALLEESEFAGEQRERFDEFRAAFDPVRELRNLLAHGHYCLDRDPETGKWSALVSPAWEGIFSREEEEPRSLSFDELLAGLEVLDRVTELFHQVRGTEWKEIEHRFSDEEDKATDSD